MLKDLMHAIFKEDVEEEIDDIEDEKGNEEEVVEEAEVQSVAQVQPQPESQPQPIFVAPVEHPVYEQPQAPTASEDESIFEGLDVDTISARPKRKNENYHFDRSKLNRARKKAEDIEYQAVISPIFGNMEDSQKQFDKVHDAVQLPKPETNTDMIEIISPMYGNNLPEQGPVESIPTYQEVKESAKPKLDLKDMLDQKEYKE